MSQRHENPYTKQFHYTRAEFLHERLPLMKDQGVFPPDPAQALHEPYYEPITSQIRSWAERTPEAPALCQKDRVWNYREFSERAYAIAHTLRMHGLTKGQIVAVIGSRNFGSMVGMLGILLKGAVMMPIDHDLPERRIKQMLQEVDVKFLLAVGPQSLHDAWRPEKLPVLYIDPVYGTLDTVVRQSPHPRPEPAEGDPECPPLEAISPEAPAYIFFTSGTTGTPKAILGAHKGISHFLAWQRKAFDIDREDRCAQLIGFSFDAMLRDIFLPLTSGATLCLPGTRDALPDHVLTWLEQERISVLHSVPSLIQTWLANTPKGLSLQTLRYLFLSGEPLSETLVAKWRQTFPQSACEIVNLYGPTETTMIKTFYRVPRTGVNPGIQPAGKPLPETQLLVVDEENHPCPIGETGEILVRTPFRTLGYINAPEEQQRRFIKNPFRADPHDVLYRTGDFGRYRSDGTLEILGRLDDQVKIRGVRVEPQEIEVLLEQHPSIWQVVVNCSENNAGGKQLIAYIRPKKGEILESRHLRDFLQELLPPAMIPARFVMVEAFPLTPYGKVDRQALAAMNDNWRDTTQYTAPTTDLERWLVTLWQEMLQRDRIGIHDNFFELGGDSIKAAQVINVIQEHLQEVVHIVSIFDAQTVAELAEYLRKHYDRALAGVFETETLPLSESADRRITMADVGRFQQFITPYRDRRNHDSRTCPKNPAAIFILSPPRSGSTLLRVLLGGHPHIFAPPELKLLSFPTLAERRTAFSGNQSFALEGLLRAIMEIKECSAEHARHIMQQYEDQGLSSQQLYLLLQQWIGDKMLVDKSTNYALESAILQRAEKIFEQPLYIHLLRHPCGMIHSFEKIKLDQVFFRYEHSFSRCELAELIWLVSHQNILDFFEHIPQHRRYVVKFEELVSHPRPIIEEICQFLHIEFFPEMLQPYRNPKQRMTDGLYDVSRMLGDPKFHTYQRIEAHVADAWKEAYREDMLGDATRAVAKTLGYLQEKNNVKDAQQLLGQLDQLSDEEVSILLEDLLLEQRV